MHVTKIEDLPRVYNYVFYILCAVFGDALQQGNKGHLLVSPYFSDGMWSMILIIYTLSVQFQ
jgi:hypothetical protein